MGVSPAFFCLWQCPCSGTTWKCRAAAVLSMLLIPSLTGNASCQAQERANVLPKTQAGREIVLELEKLGPIEGNRQIHTTNLHFLFRMKSLDIGYFKLYGGLTVSRARGTISYRTGSVEAGTLKDETFDSTASGARSEEHTSELQSPYDLVCR